MGGARATVALRPPLRTIPRTRWFPRPPVAAARPGRVPRSVRSAVTSSSTRSALCSSSSRTSAADRARWGPGSVSAAATRARAWSRISPTVRVWSGSTAARWTPWAGVGVAEVVGGGEAVERRQRREPPRHRRGRGAGVEHPHGVQVDLDPPRLEHVQPARSTPPREGGEVGAVGPAGAGRAEPREPVGGEELEARVPELGEPADLAGHPRQELRRDRRPTT